MKSETIEHPEDAMAEELLHAAERAEFERDFAQVIASGDLDLAEAAVTATIGAFGSGELQAACAVAPEAVRIEGWSTIAAEVLQADRAFELRGAQCAAVSLDLVNRDSSAELLVNRHYHLAPDRDAPIWSPPADQAARIVLTGLAPAIEIQRNAARNATPANGERRQRDAMLAGVLILLRYHQAAARHAADPGLPRALKLFVGVEQQIRPMERGALDYGPQARATLRAVAGYTPPVGARPEEAPPAEMDDDDTARTITELREKRALLRHWPWWKDRTRRNIAAAMFEAQARALFVTAMGEKAAPGWRTSDADFDAALERYALYCGADPDQALAPIESDSRSDQHVQFTSYALEYGGPRVMRHFLRSKGHRI
jgi:hypothetical protein